MTDFQDRVRSRVAELAANGDIPGATWALVTGSGDDRAVHVESMGAYSDDSIFRVASLTKPIIGVLAAALVDDGVLGLSDPVDRWVPELADRQVLRAPDAELDDVVPPVRPLTVADVLEMGAGLGWGPALEGTPLQRAQVDQELESTWQPSALDPDEWVRRLGSVPMAHQPGEGWLYQMSYDFLTVLLERASATALDELLATRLLGPLGMTETGWSVGPSQLDRVPAQYFPNRAGERVQVAPVADPGLLELPTFLSSATGLVSTAADLARFIAVLLDEGDAPGGRVLPASSVQHLSQDRLSTGARPMAQADLGPALGWGHGVAVDLKQQFPGSHAGRFGWHGGTGTSLWVDPTAGVGAVILTQHGMGGTTGADYVESFFAAVHAK